MNMKYTSAFLVACLLSIAGLAQNNRANAKKSVPYRSSYQRIISSGNSSYEIRDGVLWAWGDNAFGQLGIGSIGGTQTSPVQVGAANNWVSVAAGLNHALGIRSDGTLWAWGNNASGQLGDGTPTQRLSPVQIGTDNKWVSIAAGSGFSVAIKCDGILWAWGKNDVNQLGDGTTTLKTVPTQIGGDNKWTNIEAGSSHTIALKSDGTMWAWGLNANGQIGDGTVVNKANPTQIGTDTKWARVAAGETHSLAHKADGTLWAWGSGAAGEIGDGANTQRLSPVQVGTDNKWVFLSAGNATSTALKVDGTLWVWGANGNGQLGNGNTTNQSSPLQIGTEKKWVNIFSCNSYTLGLKADGTVWAWGKNDLGQLGDGTTVDKNTPLQVSVALNSWLTVTGGPGGAHTIALRTNGTVWAWGYNSSIGALGIGTADTDPHPNPVQVGADNDWICAAAGQNHTLAIKSNGTLWAWGSGGNGQLGTGTLANQFNPVQVGTDNKWVSIEATAASSFALKSDGTLWAWGVNNSGQLGDGTFTQKNSPVQIGTALWQSVAGGNQTSVGIAVGGTLWGWGDAGFVGDGTTTLRNSPVLINGETRWVAISASLNHGVALKSFGQVWAWGGGSWGQIGDGTATAKLSPVQVGTDNTWIKITGGSLQTHALKSSGIMWAWGRNEQGQIGNGTISTQINSPVQVNADNNWVYIKGGGNSSFAIKAQRRQICATGLNNLGQLGDGTIVDKNTFTCNTVLPAFCGITSSYTQVPVTCTGVNNGSVTITLAGEGSGAYGTYTVDAGTVKTFTTNPFTILALTPGAHTVVIKVALGPCNVTVPVTVNTYNFSAAGTPTAPSCFGNNNGSVSVTLTGTTSLMVPGTYRIGISGTPQPYTTNPFTVTGLVSGPAQIYITSSSGCEKLLSVTVPEPTTGVTGTATSTGVSCAGNSNGTATVTLAGSGSLTPGTYKVNGGTAQSYTTNPFTVTGLAAGINYIIATVGAGPCSSDTVFVNISSPAAITGTYTATAPACFGSASGSATITLAGVGAGAPGTFTVNGGAPQSFTTNPFTVNGLASGLNNIVATVTASGPCVSDTIHAIVPTGSSATATFTTTNSHCSQASPPDGTATITLTLAGPTASGTYQVDGGTPQPFTANPFTITGLVGTHTITATVTATSCTSIISINVPQETTFATVATTAITCGGTNDGTATITITGSSAATPGTYTIDGGSPQPYTTNPFTITGLAAGFHPVSITTTTFSCTFSAGVTIAATPIVVVIPTGSPVTCTGATNGTASISLLGNGVLVPGTYTVDGGSPQSYTTYPFTVTGLAAGSHTIAVNPAGGGCGSNTVNIGTGGTLTGTGTTTATSCVAFDGAATVTLTGGSGSAPGTYTVDGGAPQSYSANPFTVTGLYAGSHTIIAKLTAGGCTSSQVIVNVPNGTLTGTAVTTAISCVNVNDGTATVTLSGGSAAAPGTYTVDGGTPQAYSANPFTVTGLAAGNHTIVATATTGPCTSTPILVTVPSANFTATYTKANVSACGPGNDGTITVTPAGPGAPFSYSWTGPGGYTAGNVSTISNLATGYYNVTITDASGCGVVKINNINVGNAFVVYITNSGTSSSSCVNTGSIILYGNAGVQPYAYSLDGVTYQTGNTFTALAAGSYTGYVKDAAGCVSLKSIIVPSLGPVTALPFVRVASVCRNDGTIEIYRSGGVGPYTYSLDNIAYTSSNIFPNLPPGSYTAYVNDSYGCTGSAPATITRGTAMNIYNVRVTKTSACVNDATMEVYVTGGIPPYTYSVNGVNFQSGLFFSGLGAGNVTITVKDARNCIVTRDTVVVSNPIIVTAYARAPSTCFVSNGQIQLFLSGGYGPYTYSLDGTNYQASNVFNNLFHNTYTGYVKDSRGCVGTLSILVEPATGCRVAFNPVTGGSKSDAAIELFKINVYPNPATTEFTLQLTSNSKEKVSLNITDVTGRRIYHSTGTATQLYKFGRAFMTGVYILEVTQGDNKQSIKLIKE